MTKRVAGLLLCCLSLNAKETVSENFKEGKRYPSYPNVYVGSVKTITGLFLIAHSFVALYDLKTFHKEAMQIASIRRGLAPYIDIPKTEDRDMGFWGVAYRVFNIVPLWISASLFIYEGGLEISESVRNKPEEKEMEWVEEIVYS